MVDNKREVEFLAKTIFGEARGCSEKNQRAVGYSILNRRDQNELLWGGDTVEGVVLRAEQYECWKWGAAHINAAIARDRDTYRTIHALAQRIYDGKANNPLDAFHNGKNPCCYYNNPKKENPEWAGKLIGRCWHSDIDEYNPDTHHRFYYWSKVKPPPESDEYDE